MRKRRGWAGLEALIGVVLAVALAVLAPALARAQDYVLGAEDVVQVSVWMHPELERTLAIRADGNITLPPIGDLKAAGMTPKQLGDRIADRLSTYLRATTTVTVTVTQYLSRSVYVQGAVVKPGRYGFETLPSLVDVLSQAGGATTGADLTAVTIVRRDGDDRRTLAADVSAVLRTGDPSALPPLRPGDTILVPGQASGGAATGEGVAVLGQVAKPGLYAAAGGQDLWTVLALAGGLTDRGKLEDVRVLARGEAGVTVAVVNLREMLDKGGRAPVVVRPGDVVVVMARGPSVWNAFITMLGLSRDALNVALLVDYFNTNGGSESN
jgi:polysaccharide export outer membrane protein